MNLYKPQIKKIFLDVIVWAVVLVAVSVISAINLSCLEMSIAAGVVLLWLLLSYLQKVYENVTGFSTFRRIGAVLLTSICLFVCLFVTSRFFSLDTYFRAMYYALISVFAVELVGVLIYKFYIYASNVEVVLPQVEPRGATLPLKAAKRIDKDELEDIRYSIRAYTDESSLRFLEDNLNLGSSNTKIFASTTLFNFETIRPYRYETIINIQKINSIRGVNELFNKINEKLPDMGVCCICYETFDHLRKNINATYPIVLRKVILAYFFIVKRIIPKLFLTNRLYFDITQGRKRYFSETEVLGRLYYCGFEVVKEAYSDNLNWVIARRKQSPQTLVPKRYGPIIKLFRVCRGGDLKPIYKLRTMYPYSEYIQSYMYEKYGTDDIGKIKDDMRITGWGKVFRKFWIDELPMIWNLLRGDLKIVGVRPVSMSNFKTYPEYLQQKRIKVKPGLIPPMYFDMPTTSQGFYDSEERYIDSYLKHPILTDIKYLFGSLYNILIKRARSH